MKKFSFKITCINVSWWTTLTLSPCDTKKDHSHDAQTMMPKPGPAASNASGCLLEIQSLGPIET